MLNLLSVDKLAAFDVMCFRFVRKKWVRVAEALIVSVMSATVAFVLIYFYHDCKPIGAANISRPLQVSCSVVLWMNCCFIVREL